jgi:hypothetical protein
MATEATAARSRLRPLETGLLELVICFDPLLRMLRRILGKRDRNQHITAPFPPHEILVMLILP